MRFVRLAHEDGTPACPRCAVADRFWPRFRGLQLRPRLEADEGVLLRPCGSVHTLFMRFPIDVVFLDDDLRVLSVRPGLRPWRAAAHRGAKAVLELPAGAAAAAGLLPGVRLLASEPV